MRTALCVAICMALMSLTACGERSKPVDKRHIEDVNFHFDRYDRNHDGFLTYQEYAVSNAMEDSDKIATFKYLDLNGNGSVVIFEVRQRLEGVK